MMGSRYISPDAPLIRQYADMLSSAGYESASDEVLDALMAGEPSVALDTTMCYVEHMGIDVPLSMLYITKDCLDDDGYGMLACQRLIDKSKKTRDTS